MKFIQFMKRQSMQSILALGVTIYVCLYLMMISFLTIPKENRDFVHYIIGFLTGGVMGAVISFYFGQSKKQVTKDGEDTGA